MKRLLALLPIFCSAAVALAIFTLIVLFGYSRYVRPARHTQASITAPVPCQQADQVDDEGPILIPYIGKKPSAPKIFVRFFSLVPGDSARLWDPPNMKPRKIEIAAAIPIRFTDPKCTGNASRRIWFCEDRAKDIYFLDSRPSSPSPSPANFVVVSWIEY
jgi:hypothetical protein